MTRKYNSKKLVYGVGIKGDGVAKVNGKNTKSYITWSNMLERCYSPRCQKLYPTYVGCTVCNEWLYFPTFKEWFDANYVEGWHLDKDMLLNGNKIYSSTTCIFVPHQLNSLFNDNGRARGDYPIGVNFHKKSGKFRVQVAIDGKNQHLGLFMNADDAYKAYLVAKKENVLRMAEKWKDKIPTKLYEALIRKAYSNGELK